MMSVQVASNTSSSAIQLGMRDVLKPPIRITSTDSSSPDTGIAGNLVEDIDANMLCVRCNYPGCDIRVQGGCDCHFHARCTPFPCPVGRCQHCLRPSSGMVLLPMSFTELEEAREKRVSSEACAESKKRKSSFVSEDLSEHEQRTGRWTAEETEYVDRLIDKFEAGFLPLVDGIKLNDFLSGMLQCKQSRLTKKMKNSKLSSKSYKRSAGYIVDPNVAREFSKAEHGFFKSIQCLEERAAIKFHTHKQWRELLSSFCVSIGQPLDADDWLNSVEEIERKASLAKDAARMQRRKLMMGKAFSQDMKNPDQGVIIDQNDRVDHRSVSLTSEFCERTPAEETDEFLSVLTEKIMFDDEFPGQIPSTSSGGDLGSGDCGILEGARMRTVSSPFLDQVMSYIKRIGAPFEHADAWVPSMVPSSANSNTALVGEPTCRLCYGGSSTLDVTIGCDGLAGALTSTEQFNLVSFSQYSTKFSFNVGCGLPGRVYLSGIPSWEQNIHQASFESFERCGGAQQCGIKTAVGIPVASPNVGRIIVLLYSFHDRPQNQELVNKIHSKLSKLSPSPTWKLVVEMGDGDKSAGEVVPTPPRPKVSDGDQVAEAQKSTKDPRIDEVVSLLGQHMPSDPTSPLGAYLQGFMSLRLLLLRTSHTDQEEELVRTLLSSYSSYAGAGRSTNDIALLLARDCMFLMQGPIVKRQ